MFNHFVFTILLLNLLISETDGVVPTPVLTLHSGHIGLYDRLLATQFTGVIQPGKAYTLDIYMGNTEEFDYIIENCVFNSRLNFVDNFGCLRKDRVFVQKWETDQYHQRPGAVKRTLIHFLASEPIVHFECQLKVIHCGGCAEQSCERQPTYGNYPTYDMPLSCTYPIGPSPPLGSNYPAPIQPYGQSDCSWWDDGGITCIPWWLWLLFLILLLLLLCCLVGIVACCLLRRKRTKRSQHGRPYDPQPPVNEKRVYTVDGAVQTLPEYKQVDLHGLPPSTRHFHNYRREDDRMHNLRQADQHGSVELRHEHPDVGARRTAAYDNPDFYDGDYFEEDGQERVVTTHYENHKTPRRPDHQTKYLNGAVTQSPNQAVQQRLQRELEEHLRQEQFFQDRSEEFVDRIEEQLRHYHPQPSNHGAEAFREETIRTMRQSSVI